MPGKKKHQRKPEYKGGKGAKMTALVEKGTKNKNARTTGQQQTSKTFTLKDEAAKSTFKSSKRLWQGEGQKLRNSPVEFVKALEIYDPGQFLREQLEASARRMEIASVVDIIPNEVPHAEMTITDVAVESPEEAPESVFSDDKKTRNRSTSISSSEEISGDESDVAFTKAADAYFSQTSDVEETGSPKSSEKPFHSALDESLRATDNEASTLASDSVPELDVSSAVDRLHLSESACTSEIAPKVNIDLVLNSLDTEVASVVDEHFNDSDVDEEDEASFVNSGVDTPLQPADAPLFVVDVDGDRSNLQSDISVQSELIGTSEMIDFQPRDLESHYLPAGSEVKSTSTPWARTVDDPVYSHSDLDPSVSSFGHAFEGSGSSKRGKRGGKQKKIKQQRTARASKRGDFEVMFDYMENAKWTDTESETDLLEEGSSNDAAEPLINQLLAGLGPPRQFEDAMAQDEEELSSSDSERADDTDIDDDMELMIDAEMEEMEFDIGYSRGKGSNNRRYGADREIVDAALYHDDFNVYEYNLEDEEQGSGGEIEASGANKRGLNKFINDLDLSDEELEATLIAQWKKDRGSKKAKKRERQRLHQDGLIGKKAKRARASHEIDNDGTSELDSVHQHIKRFVTHEDYYGIEELPMPAMEKPIRRAAHLISQAYGLKSASQGSGKRRYITFYKTKHTAIVPEADFLEDTLVRARRSLGFNSKQRERLLPEAVRQKLGRAGKPMKTRSGGAGGAGRLRDGDVVGADAPEIALQNRGRQMLEKLGWLKGSGLGAVGNQGMNVPLFATIKNTKAGL